MAFDVEGAKKAGYSDAEIAAHLAQQSNFDVSGAKKAGYSDADIVKHLSTSEAAPAPTVGGGKPVMRAPSSAVPERMPSGSDVEQYLGVANRALLPYALTAAGGGRVVTRSTMFKFDTHTGRCWWLHSYTIGSKGQMNWVEIEPPATSAK